MSILGAYRFRASVFWKSDPPADFSPARWKSGAEVVCAEVLDEPGWDFVPYPSPRMEGVFEPRREIMRRLKNSFWFSHAAYRSKARLYYGSAYDLPESLGSFNVALMGSVLLHCHSPLHGITSSCRW